MTVTRERAYQVLDSERDYQDYVYPESTGGVGGIDNVVKLLTKYVRRLDEGSTDYDVVRTNIRKIGAVAVRAIDTWDAPMRPDRTT